MSEVPRAEAERPGQLSGGPLIRTVLDAVPGSVVLLDEAGTIVLVNRETERLFGHDRDALTGQAADMLLPPGARTAGAATHLFDAPADAAGARREAVGYRRDGSEFPLQVEVRALTTDDGAFVLASLQDLSAGQGAEARFRVAVEASPHGMLMVDPRGVILMVNREIERLFGYPREQLLGQSVEALVPVSVRPRHPDLRQGFERDPHQRPMGAGRDLFGRRRDGVEFPVEIGLNPIETDEGVFVLASVIDIGPRKHAEEELRRSNEELERFAYVASHDLQEPLRTVASFVQLLARRYGDRLDGDAREYIDFAVGGAERMQRLILDLLEFSRLGTRGGTPVATDAGAAMQAVTTSLRAAIDEAGARVTADGLPRCSSIRDNWSNCCPTCWATR
ncbi:MAG: PAS domain S-box protein [Vicinamibacterales bacterium]